MIRYLLDLGSHDFQLYHKWPPYVSPQDGTWNSGSIFHEYFAEFSKIIEEKYIKRVLREFW